MTPAQFAALTALCARYGTTFDPTGFGPLFDLPDGYVAGWVGPSRHGQPGTIFVGVSPAGDVSS